MPPMYWSTGSQSSTTLRSVGAVAIHGSVKRAKYHDESTNVSMVSVSRRAGLPHCGQATFFQVGWRSSGLPGRSKRDVVRQLHRQVLHRHRHDAAGLAMDDRDRAAPVALARDAPVAQAEVDLALRRPARCRASALSSRFATSSLACSMVMPSRKRELIMRAVAVIGGVGDDEASSGPGPAGRPPACCRGRTC